MLSDEEKASLLQKLWDTSCDKEKNLMLKKLLDTSGDKNEKSMLQRLLDASSDKEKALLLQRVVDTSSDKEKKSIFKKLWDASSNEEKSTLLEKLWNVSSDKEKSLLQKLWNASNEEEKSLLQRLLDASDEEEKSLLQRLLDALDDKEKSTLLQKVWDKSNDKKKTSMLKKILDTSSDKNEALQLQRLGEESAYTFKGLYKTSDWLEISYKILTFFPIVFSAGILIFDGFIKGLPLDIFAFISLSATIYLLCSQKEYEKVDEYRRLANSFQSLHNRLELKYNRNDFTELDKLTKELNELNYKTSNLSISKVGRFWSKTVIKKEMDLNWVYKGRNKGPNNGIIKRIINRIEKYRSFKN